MRKTFAEHLLNRIGESTSKETLHYTLKFWMYRKRNRIQTVRIKYQAWMY